MQLPHNLAGGNPALFQFDIDEPNTEALSHWLFERLTDFMAEPLKAEPYIPVGFWEDGRQLKLDIMVWLEPGYFLTAPLTYTFSYQKVAMRDGKDIAPFTIKCSSTFEFPVTNEHNYVFEFRFDHFTELFQTLYSLTLAAIRAPINILVSEVVTEQ